MADVLVRQHVSNLVSVRGSQVHGRLTFQILIILGEILLVIYKSPYSIILYRNFCKGCSKWQIIIDLTEVHYISLRMSV